ncbi:MAG TPA: low temperature requirement protein A [Nitrososphaeraceae archaeon]|nr:low temperature requirement protein A [Nitrososphaeraceae archaeon]
MTTNTNHKEEERHATWLELFFDLVFVVIISQLSHFLLHEISILRFLEFLFLFIPVWWSWTGVTFYSTRFYSDDIGHRLLLLLQMGGAGAMAVNISGAFSDTFSGFAISYAFLRFILIVEYIRVYKGITTKISLSPKPLLKRYIIGFSIAAVIWFISAFVTIPESRISLWIIGLIIDIATPITAGKLQPQYAPNISHLPERMGLFTLIVLGESIVSIVVGMTDQQWNLYSVIVSSLGLCISFSLWWLYFDSSGRLPIQILIEKSNVTIYFIWLFMHFPLVVAITAVGVGIRHLISNEQYSALTASDLWLICISASIFLISQCILHLISANNTTYMTKSLRKKVAIFRIGSAVVILSIPFLFGNYGIPIVIAALITSICGFNIVYNIKYRLNRNKL